MKRQIIEAKGRLAVLKDELEVIQIEAAGHSGMVRVHLSPFEKDVAKLDIKAAKVAVDRMLSLQKKALMIKKQIMEIEETLGAI